MVARVEVPVSRAEPSPHVPETAFATDQQGLYMFVVDADGKTQRRSVVTRPASDGLVAIESGLSASVRVIVVDDRLGLHQGGDGKISAAQLQRIGIRHLDKCHSPDERPGPQIDAVIGAMISSPRVIAAVTAMLLSLCSVLAGSFEEIGTAVSATE
jgi:hypothetical protein